jgi:pilus assembly protein Flp/PilA
MRLGIPGCYLRIQTLIVALSGERGQDLVEYAIVASLISLAAIASMKGVATAVGAAYTKIGAKFSSYTS